MVKRIIEDIKIKRVGVSKPLPKKEFEISLSSQKEKIKIDKPVIKRFSREPRFREKSKKPRSILYILFFIILFIGVIFLGSMIFENVNIIITKKHQLFNLDQKPLVASKELDSTIPFDIMIISDNKSHEIRLSESEEVSLKAKGEITIYNEYSTKSEKLSAETYLSDENGKVYLTDKAVSVPGYKTDKDKKVIPGEVVVGVTSFLPGDVYNGTPSNFYINSFNGTSKYKKIYGKAETVFSGGAQGLNYSLSEKNKENLNSIANSSFKDNLLKKVDSLIPPEYIFYPDASSFSYEIQDQILSPTADANVEISGTLSVVLLKEKDLINSIKKKSLPETTLDELSTINVIGIQDLKFSFVKSNEDINKELESTNFTLTGKLDFIWEPQISQLKNNLIGASRENLISIFEQDVGIGDAVVKIFPPWKSTLPLKPNKIKITVF